ncbi:MAG: hypothetical protein ABIM99_01320 [Candidatus Dojkabacteria bacterium]
MQSDYRGNSKLFKFNLIPPKTKEEIAQLEERDNTVLYSFLLIFFGAFVFFALSLLEIILVQPSLQTSKTNIATLNSQISSYDEIKAQNGELFVKSKALDPLLEKDIKLTDLIAIAENIDSTFGSDVNVVSYKREITGEFFLNLNINDFTKVSAIVDLLKATDNVENIFIRRVGLENVNSTVLTMSISFEINKLQQIQ